MYIFDVIVIQKRLTTETLSYFSAKKADIGTTVSVPLRKKEILGLVVAVHNLADLKADIKKQDFSLRNVIDIHKGYIFDPSFVKTCTLLKNYYVLSTGILLDALTPKYFLDVYKDEGFLNTHPKEQSPLTSEISVLQASRKERISFYKVHIRTLFAKNESVCIVCPTQESVEHIASFVGEGAEHRLCVFHSKKTKKKLQEGFDMVKNHSEPILIVCTPQFLSVYREDLGLIITEEEGSRYYQSISSPYIDYRDIPMVYSSVRNIHHIIGDHVIRFSTLQKALNEKWRFIAPPVFHTPKHCIPRIVDMRPDEDDREVFQVFHKKMRDHIRSSLALGETMLLYAGRKGLAPLTLCQDCGEVLKSPESNAPLVLYEGQTHDGKLQSYYFDARTKTKYKAIDACPTCNGSKLKLLGIGVDTIKKWVSQEFPDEHLLVIEGAKTTPTRIKKSIKKWRDEKGKIIIGTEKALHYIHDDIDHIIISSIDSILSIPGYDIQETLIRLIMETMDRSQKTWSLQTRIPHHMLFTGLQTKHIRSLYDKDMSERKEFQYPPYSILLSVEIECAYEKLSQEKKAIEHILHSYTPRSEIKKSNKKNKYIVIGTARLDPSWWISKTSSRNPPRQFMEIMHRLRNLSPEYTIKVV